MKTAEELALVLGDMLNSGYSDNQVEQFVDDNAEAFEELAEEEDTISLTVYKVYEITMTMFDSDQLEDALDMVESALMDPRV